MYLDMDEFMEWVAFQAPTDGGGNVMAIPSK
jgi:formiminotetrahydrofolate cyclodeaminase